MLHELYDADLVAAGLCGVAAGGALLSPLSELLPHAVMLSAMAPAISAASNLFFMESPSFLTILRIQLLHLTIFRPLLLHFIS